MCDNTQCRLYQRNETTNIATTMGKIIITTMKIHILIFAFLSASFCLL